MSKLLPAGTWLVFDPQDVRMQRDYSVWKRSEARGCNALLVIDWFGMVQNAWTDGVLPDRFIWVRIDDTQLAQLEMAAHHRQFRPLAIRMWERIMA